MYKNVENEYENKNLHPPQTGWVRGPSENSYDPIFSPHNLQENIFPTNFYAVWKVFL